VRVGPSLGVDVEPSPEVDVRMTWCSSVPWCGRGVMPSLGVDVLWNFREQLQRLTDSKLSGTRLDSERDPWVLREYVDNGTGLYKALLLL
jgi:hypothetical protein